MNKTILITGGAGFIGSNLIELLIKNDNFHIICLDNFFTGKMENIEKFINKNNFTLINQDIIDPINIDRDINEIYHLACPASPPKYQIDPVYTLKINFIGTMNLLDFAVKKKLKFYLHPHLKFMENHLYHHKMKIIEEMLILLVLEVVMMKEKEFLKH